MKVVNGIELEKAKVELLNGNLVRIIVKENTHLEESDILKINDTKNSFVNEKPYTVIFTAPKVGSISRKARELSASETVTKNAICKAIIAPGKVSKIIGNFFISYMKPGVPIKVFSDEATALVWMEEVKQKAGKTAITN